MLTFLFWNLKKKNIPDVVTDLVREHQVDILMLAENAIPAATLLRHLNPTAANYCFNPSRVETLVDIFTAFPSQFIQPQADARRASIRRVALPAREEFLLCAIHFQSTMFFDDLDQSDESSELNTFIREQEEQAGHSRTVVMGDLNMNPFSRGVTSASGFNAVMTRDVAVMGSRQVQGRDHPFFFNPMWSHFSDGSKRPAGTFFYHPSKYPSIYWHMLDQVLIRPALISKFDASTLRILDAYSNGRLVGANGRPTVSDHLPIMFKLNI